ncbi:MAG: SAM hydrolase/SAM-dependent halogenase family protein [Chitinivibrionales bacterium]
MSTIALLTDFGTGDWFVASMKGIIAGINPTASIIDITHEINQGDIRSASVVLSSCYCFFPEETVFVVVVDPGVGSSRKAIAARDHNRFFIAPDNGVLSSVLTDSTWVHQITNQDLLRHPVSNTFHGRDIFAPVGAHLSNGKPLSIVGQKLSSYEKLPSPMIRKTNDALEAEIIYIDHFGNAFSAARSADLWGKSIRRVSLPDGTAVPVHSHYAAVAKHSPLALINSEGYLEIAVNGGNAARQLNLSVGSVVTIS